MDSIKKRKLNNDPGILLEVPAKKAQHDTRLVQTQPSPDASPAKEPSPSIETDEVASKSFRELGIIESLCEACTALGYKVCPWCRAQKLGARSSSDVKR